MEQQQTPEIYLGDRLPRFQAAAACLGAGPMLRGAGLFCIIVGAISVLLFLAHGVTATPAVLIYFAFIGFGIYLYTPDPQPWALPAAGFLMLAVLADTIYFEYEAYRRYHRTIGGGGLDMILDIGLAVMLLAGYVSYKRNRSATDPETLAELRALAIGINKADLDQDAGILELTRRNDRLRIRRLDGLVLLVSRRYIAFGRYSKLDGVAFLKPEALTLTGVGTPKPGKAVRVQFAIPGKKTATMKIKPQYLSRISALGIPAKGLPEGSANAAI